MINLPWIYAAQHSLWNYTIVGNATTTLNQFKVYMSDIPSGYYVKQ